MHSAQMTFSNQHVPNRVPLYHGLGFHMSFSAVDHHYAGFDLESEGTNGRVIPFRGDGSAPLEHTTLNEETRHLIRRLRGLWRDVQLTGQQDFDHGCLLIATSDSTALERYATAFFQGVQLFARRRLVLFNAKSEAVSGDEMWIARLLQSIHSNDYVSARYLMESRIAPGGRRRLMFLAKGLASHLLTAASIKGSAEPEPSQD